MIARTTSSDSLPSRGAQATRARRAARLGGWFGPLLAALLFLAVHLAFLAPTLDDIDAVNFAFGLRAFDPASHHPHPPGYPVYIALGKMSAPIAKAIRPAGPRAPLQRDHAALALALWSALSGAVVLLASYAVFLRLEALSTRAEAPSPGSRGAAGISPGHQMAFWGAVLAACAPLTWLTASRPMSDVPGLAAALVAQALLLEAWLREDRARGVGRRSSSWVSDPLTLGALAAGLTLGVRSQVLWLTLPLLVAVLVTRSRRRRVRDAIPGACAYAAGVAAWFIPMLVVTGAQRYLVALGGQGGEDFSGVDMLWTHFGARRLAVGLWQTFVLPWSSPLLAVVVLLAAGGGLVVLWRHGRAAVAWIALLAAPYAVFHTLFHETITTRYALPLVPMVAYLAVRAFATAGARVAAVALLLVLGGSLSIGLPAIHAYAATASPVFQALGVLDARGARGDAAPVLGLHRSAKPALDWAGDAAPWLRRLPSPQHNEWSQAVAELRGQPGRPVWFLADRSRRGELRFRDLALVDPRSVRGVREFRWNVAPGLLSGVRPDTVDLYEIRAPGWVAGEGWALTPETAGIADKMRRGPFYGPIEALVRRRPDETVVLVGGRHLGGGAEGAARLELRVDGRPVGDFVVDPEPQFFLRMMHIPAGALNGTGVFGTLTIGASVAAGAPRAMHVAIEQFDIAGVDGVLAGYDSGWQENEYDVSREQMWRWASERATLLVHAGGGGPLSLRLTGESPRKYFDRPSTVKITVGDSVLWSLAPDARLPRLFARLAGAGTFSAAVPIDRDALARAGGRITLETDQFFVPADRGQGGDRRHLALRVLQLQVLAERPSR